MAKQLFKTSENSNFILNLTEEKYSKLASWGLLAACFTTSIATAIPVISRNKEYSISSAGLSVAGVVCMVIALIGVIKKYITKKMLVPVCSLGVMLLWGVISLINSYDKDIAFYGFPGRGEGLLAIIFYVCFFLTAVSIKRDKALKTLIYGILGNGLLNCVFAAIQIFTGKFSDFRMVSMKIQINAASGVSQSPIFLAMALSLSIAAALIGAVIFSGRRQKIFCIVSAAIFSFTIMFTYSLMGICGALLAVISAVVTVFALKAPKKNLMSVLAVIIPAAAAVTIVQCGLIGNISGYRLYDGRILWFADSYMRLNASGSANSDYVDIDDTGDVYYVMNRKTMDIISAYGLTGTGPDQLVYPQLYTYGPAGSEESAIEDVTVMNKGTFDRVYNEYLNIAATRGIPSVIAFAAFLLGTLYIGFKNFRKKRNGSAFCMLMLTGISTLIFFIGCSSTAFAPIFWTAAGCCCAEVKGDDKK